jgi:anaerobic selenocysteine-containing dehydrogenase
MRAETDILASVAERILPPNRFDWATLRSHVKLRDAIAQVVPGYAAIQGMEQTRQEFQVAGRTFHTVPFATKDGKAHFHVTPLPEDAEPYGEFRLMTLRSEGQFNSVVYDEEDLYRGNMRRDVVMMCAQDAAKLGVAEGDPVVVETEAGQMRVLVSIIDIAPGSLAMYYPEANRLVPRKLDPLSKTPGFKSAAARVKRSR